MEGNDQSTITYISFNQSELDISKMNNEEEEKDYSNFRKWTDNILNSFNEIKTLRKNFILDEYDKLTKKIRKNIRDIRKTYFNEKSENENIKKLKKKNKIQSNSNQQYSSTNQSNIITNIPSNQGNNSNTNSRQENINTNVNTNTYNKITKLNETSTSFLENRKEYNKINNNKKNMYEIYNILLEIVSFLLCYEDIYINYENKSSYFTLKLFLQMSTLHFFKNIEKHDFILMLINKISNILIKYNYLQKSDESTKKILTLNEKEINNLKDILIYDKKFMKQIQNKLKIEIDKIDLTHKVEKIKEEKILENLIINKENQEELEINFEDDINYKFHKLNLENEILENIQNNLDENHKMFLKEPIKKELEIFNLLMNKLSKYKTPLIKKKFIEIIVRNKEIFKRVLLCWRNARSSKRLFN